jgi:hypothetical protein
MPHSPRWHEGRLWLLESGTGQLVLIDLADGRSGKGQSKLKKQPNSALA